MVGFTCFLANSFVVDCPHEITMAPLGIWFNRKKDCTLLGLEKT
jgi:hypothetical protein